ncbi:MAG: hypothetical protein HY673_00080, partial [Chloroflexi bacterium]|nr:hypothetical protein [Chloroflexota bacterium]
PKPSPTPLALEVSGWEATIDGDNAAVQIRFTVNKATQLRLLDPEGEEVAASTAIDAIERQVTVRMARPRQTPKAGTYQLYAREGGQWILVRELAFEGPRLSVKTVQLITQPLTAKTARNQFSVRGVRLVLSNTGDLPAFLGREMDVSILGTASKFNITSTSPRVSPHHEASFEATGNVSPFFSDLHSVEMTLVLQSEPPVNLIFSVNAGIP